MKNHFFTSLSILFFILFTCCTSSPEKRQDNQSSIQGDGNTVIQVNLKIENIELNEPINEGSIVLKIDDQTFKTIINQDGLVHLDLDSSFINKPAKLIILDKDGNEQTSKEYIVQNTNKTPYKIPIPPFKRFVIDKIQNEIAQGGRQVYSFKGEKNVPILIQVKNTKDLTTQISLLNSETELVKESSIYHSNNKFIHIPYTPPKDEEYTIQVHGKRNYGEYIINVIYIDTESNLSNQELNLHPEQQHYDKIGQGSFDSYLIQSTPNQSIIIKTKSEEELNYNIGVYNELEEKITESNIYYPSKKYHTFAFTPQDSGIYTIRITAQHGFGDYDIRYRTINPIYAHIEKGTVTQSEIASGAYHEYFIQGKTNESLSIKTMGSKNLNYKVEIYNSEDLLLLNTFSFYNTEQYEENIFTPSKDDTYKVIIRGMRNFGKYKLLVKNMFEKAP